MADLGELPAGNELNNSKYREHFIEISLGYLWEGSQLSQLIFYIRYFYRSPRFLPISTVWCGCGVTV